MMQSEICPSMTTRFEIRRLGLLQRNYQTDDSSFFIIFVKTLAMQILQKSITRAELAALAQNTFGDMIKCVADVRQGLLALDAELHADLERLLLENGSAAEDLWGFNLYPGEEDEDFIEYDSLINIRSWQNNPTRDVLDPDIREAIKQIVEQFIFG